MAGKINLWDAACVLWGHIPAAEYRKVIIGLIFLRYVSAAFDRRYQELLAEGEGFENDRDAYMATNVFFVPEEARWDKIASAAHTPEIGMVIDKAMRAIEADNLSLKNVLPKNYAIFLRGSQMNCADKATPRRSFEPRMCKAPSECLQVFSCMEVQILFLRYLEIVSYDYEIIFHRCY